MQLIDFNELYEFMVMACQSKRLYVLEMFGYNPLGLDSEYSELQYTIDPSQPSLIVFDLFQSEFR